MQSLRQLTSSPARRAFLIGAGAVAVGLLSAPLWRPGGLRGSIVAIVRRLLGNDIAADDVLLEFADFYIRRRTEDDGMPMQRRTLIRAYATYAPMFDAAAALGVGPLASRIPTLRQDIGEAFIENTNMAYRQPDEPIFFFERPRFGPLVCVNRIARFDYED